MAPRGFRSHDNQTCCVQFVVPNCEWQSAAMLCWSRQQSIDYHCGQGRESQRAYHGLHSTGIVKWCSPISGLPEYSQFSSVTCLLYYLSASPSSQWNWPRAKTEEKLCVQQRKPAETVFQQELNKYMEEPNVQMPDVGCTGFAVNLRWWSGHKNDYPNLSWLARIYLAIPATSVSSEHTFSKTAHYFQTKTTANTQQSWTNSLWISELDWVTMNALDRLKEPVASWLLINFQFCF